MLILQPDDTSTGSIKGEYVQCRKLGATLLVPPGLTGLLFLLLIHQEMSLFPNLNPPLRKTISLFLPSQAWRVQDDGIPPGQAEREVTGTDIQEEKENTSLQ